MRASRAQLVSCVLAGLIGCGGGNGGAANPDDGGPTGDDTGLLDDAAPDSSVDPAADSSVDGSDPDSASLDSGALEAAVGDDATTGDASESGGDAAPEASTDAATPDTAVAPWWDPQCVVCHGSTNPAPPRGLDGETATNTRAVGAHQSHLGTSTWHREVACNECHVVPKVYKHDPTAPNHWNGIVEVTWGATAKGGTWDTTALTCSGTWCHGAALFPDAAGKTSQRTPLWTKVDGTQKECGKSCHTTPPGGTHPPQTNCQSCHAEVIASFDPATGTATWKDASKHIDGTVQWSEYHDLPGWVSPIGSSDHHGRAYFVGNHQKDEHGQPCTSCHGADLNGGTAGVSCNNASCHRGTDWKGCTFCHGTPPSQNAPPLGVWGETTTDTLGVGRHTAHLSSSISHTAFACATCHVVPAAGDVAHAIDYAPSVSLDTAGHHGDVTFSGGGVGGTFAVSATVGTPVTARGTCLGGCHSNGRGGAPRVTPYWAGGSWTKGDCTACHANSMSGGLGGHHSKHSSIISTCASCHPDAAAGTHMNGAKDVNPTVTGTSVTVRGANTGGPCGTKVGCSGTCHGETHGSGHCW
jgi:predicted CxxxxCH...CXXCH cytochrome family protein